MSGELSVKKINVPTSELENQAAYSGMVQAVLPLRFNRRPPLAMVRTFGCQGNVADSERIQGMLTEMGFGLTDGLEEADFVIFNTCAIREHAEDRVFGNVGELKHKKETDPGCVIALCGCMMQQERVVEKIKSSFGFVDMVFGTHALHRLPELVLRFLTGGKKVIDTVETGAEIAEGLPVKRDSSFKAWLPVMYGCDNFCSYCVVPYVRGRERSREPSDVLAEAKQLADSGYKDITLLGQNVNSYGKGNREVCDFPELLKRVSQLEGEFLIRFMTSHPKDCSKRLLDTMASCNKVAKHLHLPFQSGNNRILKAMNRGYTREDYLELIAYAKEVMPGLSVTSDVIVGFPGETYEEFLDTLSLIDAVDFTSLFTFIYSRREGTAAASQEDKTGRAEKVERFQQLTKLQEEKAAKHAAAMTGKTVRVLCERKGREGGSLLCGRTQGNSIIEFEGPEDIIGTFRDVKVTKALTWMLKGELS